MRKISFKISDKEYEELKSIKDGTWNHFFLSCVSCPYCGNLFLFSTGKKLVHQQTHNCISKDDKFGEWPYIRKEQDEFICRMIEGDPGHGMSNYNMKAMTKKLQDKNLLLKFKSKKVKKI